MSDPQGVEGVLDTSHCMIKQFFTYIAICNDQSYYVGITDDIQKREKRHNDGFGCEYTRIRRPIKIVYFEIFFTRSEAAKRERQLKGWTRKKKEWLMYSLKNK